MEKGEKKTEKEERLESLFLTIKHWMRDYDDEEFYDLSVSVWSTLQKIHRQQQQRQRKAASPRAQQQLLFTQQPTPSPSLEQPYQPPAVHDQQAYTEGLHQHIAPLQARLQAQSGAAAPATPLLLQARGPSIWAGSGNIHGTNVSDTTHDVPWPDTNEGR